MLGDAEDAGIQKGGSVGVRACRMLCWKVALPVLSEPLSPGAAAAARAKVITRAHLSDRSVIAVAL